MVSSMKQSGCNFHSDLFFMDVNQIRVQLRMIGEDKCELATQTLGQQIAASQVSGVISNRTGVELEYGQMYHLNRKLMREQMDLDAAAVLSGTLLPLMTVNLQQPKSSLSPCPTSLTTPIFFYLADH